MVLSGCRVERNSDGRADGQRMAVDHQRRRQCGQDPVGHFDRIPGGGDVGQQDPELVASQPRDRVLGADAALDASRDEPQQRVAAGVPERVIDGLEVVDIEEQHRRRAAVAVAAGQRLPDAVLEQSPIGQSGQLVVVGATAQLGFQAAALGDVADVDDDAFDAAVRREVVEDRFDEAQRPCAPRSAHSVTTGRPGCAEARSSCEVSAIRSASSSSSRTSRPKRSSAR